MRARSLSSVQVFLMARLMLLIVACVQLVPLDRHTLRDWSPATQTFLKQYSLQYAMATARSEDLAPRWPLVVACSDAGAWGSCARCC